jgi:hypothetical protein
VIREYIKRQEQEDNRLEQSKRPTIHVCHIIVADDMFAL